MILFVCTGNICRSPAADGILRALLNKKNKKVKVDSAGLGAWHIGESPDRRAIKAAQDYGFDISYLKARQINLHDFHGFDEIMAMDDNHYKYLIQNKPQDAHCNITYFCDWFMDKKSLSVKDPYYGTAKDFDMMIQQIIKGCEKIAKTI